MRHCPRIKTLLSTWDYRPNALAVARMGCKQWDCPYCAKRNAEIWKTHLNKTLGTLLLQERWIFVTLTVPSELHEMHPVESLKRLKAAWIPLRNALKWKNGGKLEYVLVYETHKSGIFHAHALLNMGAAYDAYNVPVNYRLPYEARIAAEKAHPFCQWLSKQAEKHGLGWVCHATRIREGATGGDNARLAVGYVTKYLSKGVGEIVFPPRTRRIQTSFLIGSPRAKLKSKWAWAIRAPIYFKNAVNMPIWVIGEQRLLAANDFGDDGYYPALEFAAPLQSSND